MNFDKYPWLRDLDSPQAKLELAKAKELFDKAGAIRFPHFITDAALQRAAHDARAQEDQAFTTDDHHTAYLKPLDTENFACDSVYNHEMRTQVASTAYDELPGDSPLSALYQHPTLLRLVSAIVGKKLFLSEDPLGACSINVFRPSYHHSFHFDESEFSTTLCLQAAQDATSGLFQYTDRLRGPSHDLALSSVAAALQAYDPESLAGKQLDERTADATPPTLHTLDFQPGTLFIFNGSRSLHRVTRVKGHRSRLVAVLTFATRPGFCNSAEVQTLFWGRSVPCQTRVPEESDGAVQVV